MATGTPQLDAVTINSVSVDAYKSSVDGVCWELTSNQDNSTIRFVKIWLTKAVEEVLTMDETLNSKSVVITRGVSAADETYVFRGEVVSVIPDGGRYQIVAADKMYATTKRTVTTTFDINIDSEAGVISEIFKTLVNDYTPLSADNTSVQNSGTSLTLTRFICRAVPVFDRLKTLADTLGWQYYYDPTDDLVHFEPLGYVTQATEIIGGTNLLKEPKWERDSQDLYNIVEVRGAVQEVETTESGQIGVTTGYTTTEITLQHSPNIVKVYCDASTPPTTLRTPGKAGSTETYDYSIESDNKQIVWHTADYTPGSSDYVEMQYTYFIPAPVIATSEESINLYSEGDIEKAKKIVIEKKDMLEVSDAEMYANQYLDDHKDPIDRTTLRVMNVSDLAVGQKVYVNDTWNNIVGWFYVTSVRMKGPYRYDEVTVASNVLDEDQYAWNILQRLKRLEEQNIGDDELVLHTKQVNRRIRLRRRCIEMQKRDLSANDNILLGHHEMGVIGPSGFKLGPSSETYTVEQIHQGNNTYEEYFLDDDFEGSGTGTWDTSGHQLTLGASASHQTSRIALGTAYSYYTLTTPGSVTGTVSIEISGDNGSTWESVTLGTRTAFDSSDGSGILIKITDSGGSGAIIAPSYDAYGQMSAPGLQCVLEA